MPNHVDVSEEEMMTQHVIVEFGPPGQFMGDGRGENPADRDVKVYGPFDGEPPAPEELARQWLWSRWTTGVVARRLDGVSRVKRDA